MVEFKLESLVDRGLPKDCYISFRVGDVQKLSRFAGSKGYRFQKGSESGFGKIEVFRRIGACSIDLESLSRGTREVNISCEDADCSNLGLRVELQGPAPEQDKATLAQQAAPEEPAKLASEHDSKVLAAKEYLDKHSLEVRLSEAMLAVLTDRPEDPLDYFASRLLKYKQAALSPDAGAIAPPSAEAAGDAAPPAGSSRQSTKLRRLQGLSEPSAMSIDEVLEAERVLSKALLQLTGDFAGTYLPLKSSMSYIPRPGGMTEEEASRLEGQGLLFPAVAEGAPPGCASGRGVFATLNGDFAAWVNESDHLRLIAVGEARDRLEAFEAAVAGALEKDGQGFA